MSANEFLLLSQPDTCMQFNYMASSEFDLQEVLKMILKLI